MYFELQKLEKESGIYLPDSPTQKINYQVVNELNKTQAAYHDLKKRVEDNYEAILRGGY